MKRTAFPRAREPLPDLRSYRRRAWRRRVALELVLVLTAIAGVLAVAGLIWGPYYGS